MNIGHKIKELRALKKVTQIRLAEYLNISHQSISKWEKGIALPSVVYVVPIAQFLCVSLYELFEEEVKIK